MPTVHPRYTVTDTGELREMLDRAQSRWPQVADRRQLLLRLAAVGSEAIDAEYEDETQRRQAQREALAGVRELVDVDVLMSDAAWK